MNWRTYLLPIFIINIACNTLLMVPSSTLTLVSSVSYLFNYTYTSRTIAASTTVALSLSLNYNINTAILSNCMFATTTSISYTSTTCTVTTNSSGNYILFSNIFPTQLTSETLLSIRLNMPNPWGAGTQNINMAYLASGTNITQSQTGTLTYTASSLNSCQWLSSSSMNGVSSTRTISFIPSVQLIQTSYLQVTIPFWFQTTSNVVGTSIACNSMSNVDYTPTCSYTTIGSNQVFTFSNLFSSNKTVSTAVSLSMSNLYNPWSLNPFSPIVFQLYNTQNGVTRLTQSCSGLSQTTSSLNSFSLFSMTGTFTTISLTNSNRVIQFTARNPIPSGTGGQLRISWTGGVSVTYTTQTGVIVLSRTSSQIIITNFSSTNILSGTNRFLFGWSYVNPPSTRAFTISLTSMFLTGGTTYGIDTMTNTYSCNSGTIITYSLVANTYAINRVATYTITFTNINALTSGSYIGITFPTHTSLVLGSTCSSTNSLLACNVANTTYANISITGAITVGRSLSITFNSVNNPTQALVTTSFIINTYYDSGLDSLVDRLTSGMTLTSVANELTSNVFVVPSSLVTYTSTSYLFSLQLLDQILSGGYFYISFPSSLTLGSIALTNPSFPSSSCVISTLGNIVNITSCFSSDYSSLAITFTLTGITNPTSFQPSTSFAISTYGPTGQINYINSGLTVTMTTAATSTAFSISSSLQTVHAYAAYTSSLTFFVPHVASDYILMTIPSSMQFSASPSCSAIGIAVIACSIYNTTTIKITISSIPSTTVSLTITSIRNYDISSTSIPFQLYVYNSANYLMEITSTSSITYSSAAITTYSVSSNNQIVLNQASNITITFTPPFGIDSSFSSSLTSILITIPAQFTLTANSSCISSVGTSCNAQNSTSYIILSPGVSLSSVTLQFINIKLPYLNGSSTSFIIQYLYNNLQIATVTSGVAVSAFCTSPCQQCTTSAVCLTCLPSPNTNILYFSPNYTCLNICPTGYYANSNNCSVCVSPCSTCSTAAICIACVNGTTFYPSNSSCLSSCPSGSYNSSNNCSTCISPCSTCNSSTTCLSCVASNYLTNLTCVNSSSCPSGTYANLTTLICETCQSPCATCLQSQLNCSTCISSYLYYNSTCLSVCPQNMYSNSSSCIFCISPCYNCSSSTFCLSCISTYVYNGSCYNSSMCPSGTFANTTSLTCETCAISCSTCSLIAANCTSCRSPYFNYNGSCVNACPDGLYVNASICLSCVSPCKTCSNTTICLSCSTNYYTNNSCVNASQCPNGTFANATSLNCDSCSNNCTGCSQSSSNCTSCSSTYQYFNNTCITTCPSGMYPSSNICQTCVSPCKTCTNSTICLSCLTNFYTNFTCVNESQCPSGTFGNTSSLQCDPCTSNCTTCFSSSSNCTACNSSYAYYNYQCISSCPNGTYLNSSACTNCSLPCNQCTSNLICVNCAANYYYYNQSCLSSALCPNGTYADTFNLNCSACLSPCVNCFNTSSNCTSCISSLLYNNNQCVSACPYQMFNSSGICTSCVLPCGNCTNASICLSCISEYLSAGSCVNSSSCPNGTYAESANNTCSACISPCTICYTTTNCTTCSSPYSYYSFSCMSTCPNGTYSSSSICVNCSSSCLTCNSTSAYCTSCGSSLNFYNYTCISGCPPGTYNSSGNCVNCSSPCYWCSSSSICAACNGSLFLTNSTCLSTCPSGTYSDISGNICQNCSSSCLTCSISQGNCTSCPSNLLYSSYSCQSACPSNYFNVSGICTTCPNCSTCNSSSVCYICNSGLYLYNGVCYSSCPPVAPIPNTITFTCSLCGSSCSTCNGDGTYCFTCATGYLILTGQCYLTCPSGYTADKTNTQCSAIKAQKVAYFPFTISFFCISILAIFSKIKYPHSDLVTNITAFSALSFLFSIVVFTFTTYSSSSSSSRLLETSTLDNNSLTLILGLGIVVISVLLISGLFFIIYICRKFQNDAGLKLWKKNSNVNKSMYGFICVLSCFNFAIYRFTYGKIFLRECFSCYIRAHKQLTFVTNLLTFIVILFAIAPSIALSIYISMKLQGSSQVQILAVDNMIISSLLGILLLLDMGSRNPQDFQVILQDFPYLKRTRKYQDLDSSSGSLVSIIANQQQKHYKTQVDYKETGKLKDVSIEDKLGNFGAISHLEDMQSTKTITKTLPEFKNLTAQIDFNPYQLKRQNDDLFFQEKEYTKKFNELKETYHKGATIFQQQFVDDDGLTHHNQDLYKQHNVQEIINTKRREIDPQEFLQKFRSEDYDNISPQQLAILMEMAQGKGLDPTFMKETFGKNKYFNKKILEQLIGDHQQVSKQSAQQLLNDSNSQTKLRQVLGNKSTINTDKLIQILNDDNHKEIIQAMFNKQTAFLSIDAIKDLLADNNKYSKDFIINLLNNKNIDKQKLQILIDSNKEGELDTLQTIKDLGGDDLQRKERMNNMLGKQSALNPALIPKIKKEMSEESTSNIFDSKSPTNTTVIKKVINNKRIKLNRLNPIQQIPQLVEQFAQILACGNEEIEEDLIQLLQNDNYDGQKLKELIANSGNNEQGMNNLLQFIKENKEGKPMEYDQFKKETPLDQWMEDVDNQQSQPSEQGQEQQSLPSLNFSLNEDNQKQQKNKIVNNTTFNINTPQNQTIEDTILQSKLRGRTRFRKKQPKPIHLPSQEIYLQRLQAPHEVQKNKKFRKAKKKVNKANKFMDQDNQVYDLDF